MNRSTFFALILALTLAGCAHETPQPVSQPASQPEAFVPYDPYLPLTDPGNTVREDSQQIRPGMTEGEVVRVLGRPTDERMIPDPKMNNAAYSGKTFWYLTQEPVYWGNKDETHGQGWVRVTMNQAGKVTQVDRDLKSK